MTAATTLVIAVWTIDRAKNEYTVGKCVVYGAKNILNGKVESRGIAGITPPGEYRNYVGPDSRARYKALRRISWRPVAANLSPLSVRHHISTRVVEIEVREWKVISSLRNTKVGLNKDHVRRRAAAELSHGTPSVDPGGNSLNINHEQLIDTSRCPLFDRVP